MSARIGSLFSGYGGLDLAVQSVYDAEHAWFCEFDDAPSKILAHHWPDVPNHRDVTTVDWSTVEPVDILTGGFPCQDVSVAGRRAGMTDGTRSGLWSHMAHAIDVLRPQLVVIENVGGLFSANATSVMESHPLCLGDGGTGSDTVLLRAIDAVLSTLSELGYDAEWTALRASDVGAAHGRLRVFITAHPAPDASGGGSGRWATLPLASGTRGADVAPVRPDDRPDAPGSAPRLMPTPRATDGTKGGPNQRGSSGDLMLPSAVAQLLPTPVSQPSGNSPEEHLRKKPGRDIVTDLSIIAENGLFETGGRLLPTPEAKLATSGPDYARVGRAGSGGDNRTTTIALLPTPMVGSTSPAAHGQISGDYRRKMGEALDQMPAALIPTPSVADATGGHERRGGARGDELLLKGLAKEGHLDRFGPYAPVIGRWEQVLGRPAPDPTEPGKNRPRLSARFVEFLMGLDDGHVTDVGLTRNQQLKALGNGVVPQQGAAALAHLDQIRRTA